MKVKRTLANDLFWIFAVASAVVSGYAVGTLEESAFYCSAALTTVAFCAFMADGAE